MEKLSLSLKYYPLNSKKTQREMYLVVFFFWLHQALFGAHVTFCCSIWDLVPWPGNEPGTPALGAWSLSHWNTREVPDFFLCWILSWKYILYFLNCVCVCVCVCARAHAHLVSQLCPTTCNAMDCTLLGPLSMEFFRKDTGMGCHFLLLGMFLTQG